MKKLLSTACVLLSIACPQLDDARPIEAGQSPVSSALAISSDDQRLVIAAEDYNVVVIVYC
jgi:hypothetical protein